MYVLQYTHVVFKNRKKVIRTDISYYHPAYPKSISGDSDIKHYYYPYGNDKKIEMPDYQYDLNALPETKKILNNAIDPVLIANIAKGYPYTPVYYSDRVEWSFRGNNGIYRFIYYKKSLGKFYYHTKSTTVGRCIYCFGDLKSIERTNPVISKIIEFLKESSDE